MPNTEHKSIAAIYVSVWDGGIEVRTPCKYAHETNHCFDIELSDVEGVECRDDEYVLLPDGTALRAEDGVTFDY